MLQNLEKYDVVLASNSPRRQQLLSELGVSFRVGVINGLDERYPHDLPAMEVAGYLAGLKADAYQLEPHELLITADTTVVLGDCVLGKPVDEAEACRMLRDLSGRSHHVVTGVCIRTQDFTHTFQDVTEVEFVALDDDEIEHYVRHYRPMDKAGAYGIQEWIGCMGVRRVNGCFYNVMGLPVPRLYALLKTL